MLTASLVLLLALFLPANRSNRHTINQIFERSGLYTRDLKGNIQKPTLIKCHKSESHDTYLFKLPLGLPFKKLKILNDDIRMFSDGLNKHTTVEFKNGIMFLRVFHKNLPKRVDYIGEKLESTDRADIRQDDISRLRQDTTLSWRGDHSIWQDQSDKVHHHDLSSEQSQPLEATPNRLKSRG